LRFVENDEGMERASAAAHALAQELKQVRLERDAANQALFQIQEAAKTMAEDLGRLREDEKRLWFLESFVRENSALHLHDGYHPGGIGLGLRDRSLRQAIDEARKP
jgi:hypothetical protein